MRVRDLPDHTSATQLAVYASCPRRYAYRYIEHREPETRAVGMVLGSAVHSALAWWFEERAQEHDVGVADVLRVLAADLAAASAYDNVRWDDNRPEHIASEAERLVRTFVDRHDQLHVVETEVRFDFVIVDPDTGRQQPRPLIGYFDAELASGNIVELKTAKRAYADADLATNLQFGAYRTAARHLGVDVELIALVRTKVPKVQHAVLPHDREVTRWFMRAASAIESAVLAGHFPPAPGATCRSCEHRRACLGVEAEDVAGVEAA